MSREARGDKTGDSSTTIEDRYYTVRNGIPLTTDLDPFVSLMSHSPCYTLHIGTSCICLVADFEVN